MTENDLARTVAALCVKIHKKLGPGLLENVYEEALCYELAKSNISFRRQQGVKVHYDGIRLDLGFRPDIIVADKMIVEIKSITQVAPVHLKILLTYLRLSGKKLGLLINFNETLLKHGIKRVVNNV